jgi:hypothetical protein
VAFLRQIKDGEETTHIEKFLRKAKRTPGSEAVKSAIIINTINIKVSPSY